MNPMCRRYVLGGRRPQGFHVYWGGGVARDVCFEKERAFLESQREQEVAAAEAIRQANEQATTDQDGKSNQDRRRRVKQLQLGAAHVLQ